MHELDQKFGDIRSRIIDHETLISNSIQELVVKRRKAIFDAIEVASTLDCLISLAIVAYENDWCRPRFTNEKIINVQNGRHPIAEKVCRSRYVSNPIQ
jgi:DNA mismatch repair ATPase MutS